MALLTFMSDFGTSDGYVAAVKGRILTVLPNQAIIDVSHSIKQYNIAHGSHVLRSVYKEFPKGTVHLVAVNSTGGIGESYIAIKLDGHYFLGTDNGLLSLLSDNQPEEVVVLASSEEEHALALQSTFPSRDILAPVAIKLLQGSAISQVGEPTEYFNRMINRQPRVTPTLIAGHVVYIDNYGNLITNISTADFEVLEQPEFLIKIGREEITKLYRSYSVADAGDLFGLINSQGFLEIGVHSGNASELLGMDYDSPIIVRLKNQERIIGADKNRRLSGRLPL